MPTDYDIAFEPWTIFSAASVKQFCLAFAEVIKGLPQNQVAKVNFNFRGICNLHSTRAVKEGENVLVLISGEEVVLKDAFIVNICALSRALVIYETAAQADHFRSRVSVEKWVPAGFPR